MPEIGMTALPDRAALLSGLKDMIVAECDMDRAPETIPDDIALIGEGLELDSLDALQLSLSVKQRYGVRIEGGPDGRRAFASISALADFIIKARSSTA